MWPGIFQCYSRFRKPEADVERVTKCVGQGVAHVGGGGLEQQLVQSLDS